MTQALTARLCAIVDQLNELAEHAAQGQPVNIRLLRAIGQELDVLAETHLDEPALSAWAREVWSWVAALEAE